MLQNADDENFSWQHCLATLFSWANIAKKFSFLCHFIFQCNNNHKIFFSMCKHGSRQKLKIFLAETVFSLEKIERNFFIALFGIDSKNCWKIA